ncbi:MAG: S9 family peptidase [Acidobacteriia bacterium]|nr:S9 family peptidase [Terriglobia bacterium]
MKMTKRIVVAVVFVMVMGLGIGAEARAQESMAGARHAIGFADLMRMQRVSEARISPDGKWVAYTVAEADVEGNRFNRNIWMVAAGGGAAAQLTRSGKDTSPAWSPDGKMIAFISGRGGSGQIYLLSMEGGEARQLTHISTETDMVKWSPDGKTIAFTSAVYPDCVSRSAASLNNDDACNSARNEAREKSKVKAHVADGLLYRHWTSWKDGKREHLFVVAADGGAEPRDITAGANYDVPPDERSGPGDIAFSPDSREICFVAVTDKVEAISTNADLFTVPVAGGEAKRITTSAGFDGGPAYSPDGQWIAYRSQKTAGYESDLWRVMLYERKSGTHTQLAAKFDRSAEDLNWSADSKTIYFTAENETLSPVYALEARAGTEPKKIVGEGFNSGLEASKDGKTLVFTRSSLAAPAEVFAAGSDGSGVRQLTQHNAAVLATLEMNAAETFWFDGAGGTKVQAMMIRPPNFDAAKKYPVLVLLHGGPQTMWTNSWGYRWNEQVFSAPGYATLMINRRGSTGYGQKFTDEITGDWGGKAYEDVMKGVDAALAKYAFLDGTRMAAAGGSYGGYMADWIATHTGRFKAIISHAGVYDKVSMYATEELWFEEHDMQGTPWGNPEGYRKWAPVSFAGDLGKYKTPTLVIAGEMDYRVPYTQSLELFSALQRQEVPSRLIVFPDEGHWIMKPQNSRFWYGAFLGWLGKYLK